MKYTKPVLIKLGTIAMIKAGGGTYRDIGSNKFGKY